MSPKKGPRSGGPRPRRSFSPAQKLDLLTRYEQALAAGESIESVQNAYAVTREQIFAALGYAREEGL